MRRLFFLWIALCGIFPLLHAGNDYPDVPSKIMFCGEVVDLTRFDRNERMDRELMAFTFMHSNSIQMLKRANRFFPLVEPILRAQGVPDDMKYLMAIESNVNPMARSSAGAAGLWQFMQSAGKLYGLEVNANVDERYHVEQSTLAACKYLKEAYAKYGSWQMVTLSYNAGMARISSQIEKQLTNEALDLYLVEETTRYLYRILAAKMFFANPASFGFQLEPSELYPPIRCEDVPVDGPIPDLVAWARQHGTTYALLKLMNPWLREDKLNNASGKHYIIKIPKQ